MHIFKLLSTSVISIILVTGCASLDSKKTPPVTSQPVTESLAMIETSQPAPSDTISSETEDEPSTAEAASEETHPDNDWVYSGFIADNDPLKLHDPELLPDSLEVLRQYNESREEIGAKLSSISEKKSHPCINITTQDGARIKSKYEYVASVIDVFNCNEEYRLTQRAGVKVRGNSTADQGDEKPYRIKFYEDHNLLGLHDGREYKSWVLLRAYWNMAPDYTGFSLARYIFGGEYYSSDFTYVNLYINGKYRGLYLLCEQNQATDGRVELREPNPKDTGVRFGYLVEIDNYPSDEHPYFYFDHLNTEITDISGKSRVMKKRAYSVKSDIYTEGQLEFIRRYISGCFEILYEAAEHDRAMMFDDALNVIDAAGTYSEPRDAVEAVIDTKSLANMLILEELVHNYDVGEGSFYMAVDFTADSLYPTLTFTAPWDFNWAYEGNASGSYYACIFQPPIGSSDRSNPWFITAMKADWFGAIVAGRWAELRSDDSLYDILDSIMAECRTLETDLPSNEGWKIDAAGNICEFVRGRIKWLDEEWLR